VPNPEGRRACEAQLAAEWGKWQAGPYPSNRRIFADIGLRGERLVSMLHDAYAFVQSAPAVSTAGARLICEVFPHPAHVSLFRLESILKYKKKGERSYEECWAALEEYQRLLQTLSMYDPPLRDPEGLLHMSFSGIKGQALKVLEDQLDAVSCAYVAHYVWQHGAAGAIVYGTIEDGHIVVPRYPPR
jgi:predicted RNase H-like nuclease